MNATNAVEVTAPGFWASLRDALAGTHQDYTEGPIGRAILLLAVPMVLEMCMESLFGVVDVFWVAHVGVDAIATVALTESGLTVLFAVALGLSMAATAMVARRIGEKNNKAAGVIAVQAIILGLIVSTITGVFGYIYAADLLRVMGASESVVRTGTNYTRVMMGGSASIFLLFLINAVFRGAGDAAIAMRVLWIANAVNIFLNPCLIFGLGPFPRLGVTGSAIGTTIGRGCGVLLQIWFLTRGKSRVVVHLNKIRLLPGLMLHLIRLSVGGTFQYLVGAASWIFLVRMTAVFGSAAIAGYTLALRIILFALLPSWGMANAAATLVGQNLGARKPERAEKSVFQAGFYNMIFLGLIAIVFIGFARPLIRLFTQEDEVVTMAAATLSTIAYGYVFYAWGMVVVQAFNGAGDTVTPTILNLLCFWAWQLPLAWFLAFKIGTGPHGIFLAICVAQSTLAVAGVIAFRRGTWKKQTV